ncbi:YbfB/YjiJ family MFS transporter [Paeniroseomonas aquatica]|uniref:YbfB/YjiJ family MFS transporter n=1 Tax=Paeniroseomonas aquatica TaxID=373043 RepID=UPI00361D0A7D
MAVPGLLPLGLSATWLGLAGLVALLWALAHAHWPRMVLTGAAAEPRPAAIRGPARLLILTYGLHGAGMVPPMVYLADLAARGRGLGVGTGAATWLVFGLAGILGGILSGRAVDRLGGRATLRLWLLIQVAALALALPPWAGLVLPMAAAAGFAAVGVSAVTLAVGREIAGPQAAGLWIHCTAAFAVTQTVVGFALAAVFAATGESHFAVFAAGLGFSLAGLGTTLLMARPGKPYSARLRA